jgi:glycosyltransferase involved in cell wall biosynthesis
LVHFHNTFPLLSPAAYHAARSAGAAVVQTLHNYRLLCPGANFFRDGRVCEDCLGKRFAWPAIQHACYRGSRAATAVTATMLAAHRLKRTWTEAVDAYVALTEFARGKLIAGGLPADKIAVKPNFVSPDPQAGAGRGGYALYVGRLSAEKGIDQLLSAWRRLDGAVPLKIVGDGPLANQVREAAERDPHIERLGAQPLDKVHQLLGDAAFLVCASACYEGLPKTIVEAFAKGMPVVAPRHGAMAEIVEHGRTGLHFVPGDADSLAAQALSLFRDDRARQRMRGEARAEFEAKYTAARNYSLLLDVYRGALGRRGPSAAALDAELKDEEVLCY